MRKKTLVLKVPCLKTVEEKPQPNTCKRLRLHARILNPFARAKRRAEAALELAQVFLVRAGLAKPKQKTNIYEMNPRIYDDYMSTRMEERNYGEVFRRVKELAEGKRELRVLDLCCHRLGSVGKLV